MPKQEIKNNKFKTTVVPRKGVRLSYISDNMPVMGMERRGQQYSRLGLNLLSDNIIRLREKRLWKGKPFLNRWMRISLRTQQSPTAVFNNLLLHISKETLTEAFGELDGTKAPGVDGVTKSAYGKNLESNLDKLAERIKRGSYRPKPRKVILIPKANGGFRPIAIACFEDKLVDAVISKILSNLYDHSFIHNSFGYRPNKSAHKAIETSYKVLRRRKRPYVVEVDFSNFFNTIPHRELLEILEKKIADKKFLRLITRFLEGRTMKDDGTLEKCICGTPQGGLMSPILANIYLDEVLDKWFKSNYSGSVIIRYADDAVFFFSDRKKASNFLTEFKERVEAFKLTVNEEKSRFLSFKTKEFNQFNFLGFTFYWGIQNNRRFLKVKTEKKKLHKGLQEFDDWIKTNRNKEKVGVLWDSAKAKIRGHYEYFGYWMNRQKLLHFYQGVVKSLFNWLNRRSQKRSYSWAGFRERIKQNPLGQPPIQEKLKRLGGSYGYGY